MQVINLFKGMTASWPIHIYFLTLICLLSHHLFVLVLHILLDCGCLESRVWVLFISILWPAFSGCLINACGVKIRSEF